MTTFDYATPAEFYLTKKGMSGRRLVTYRRFASTAEAIRFAIEESSPAHLVGATLEVAEERFDGNGIRRLYDAPEYPLERRVAPG